MVLTAYEQKLFDGWEAVHKKGQLSLWIFLSLKDGAKHMTDIKAFINHLTNDAINADDKSMYRALRRFEESDMLGFTTKPSDNGPDLKVYHLTETGEKIVQAFIKRHVALFYDPRVKQLINERS